MRPGLVRKMLNEIGKDSTLTMFAGVAGILGGLAVILNHNIWEWSWSVWITLFGWSALIKGFMYLMYPDVLKRLGYKIYGTTNKTRLVLLVAFVLGVYLAGVGFELI